VIPSVVQTSEAGRPQRSRRSTVRQDSSSSPRAASNSRRADSSRSISSVGSAPRLPTTSLGVHSSKVTAGRRRRRRHSSSQQLWIAQRIACSRLRTGLPLRRPSSSLRHALWYASANSASGKPRDNRDHRAKRCRRLRSCAADRRDSGSWAPPLEQIALIAGARSEELWWRTRGHRRRRRRCPPGGGNGPLRPWWGRSRDRWKPWIRARCLWRRERSRSRPRSCGLSARRAGAPILVASRCRRRAGTWAGVETAVRPVATTRSAAVLPDAVAAVGWGLSAAVVRPHHRPRHHERAPNKDAHDHGGHRDQPAPGTAAPQASAACASLGSVGRRRCGPGGKEIRERGPGRSVWVGSRMWVERLRHRALTYTRPPP
jgi:hypothetical protein